MLRVTAATQPQSDSGTPGTTADDLRIAIGERTTHHHGTFHATTAQLGTFQLQLQKYGRDARANLGGRIRRDGTRRDLGYPRESAGAGVGTGSSAGARRDGGAG